MTAASRTRMRKYLQSDRAMAALADTLRYAADRIEVGDQQAGIELARKALGKFEASKEDMLALFTRLRAESPAAYERTVQFARDLAAIRHRESTPRKSRRAEVR